MKKLKFEELTEVQRAEVMECMISLLQRGKITSEAKDDAEHHRYGFNGTGAVCVDVATTFASGEAVAWAAEVSLFDGKPMDALRDDELPIPAPHGTDGKDGKNGTDERLQVEWADRSLFVPHPQNPRKHFDAAKMAELRANMERHGFTPALSHLLARPHPDGGDMLQIISGERRWRATEDMKEAFWSRQAAFAGHRADEGSTLLPCVVVEMTDNQALEMMHLANLDREDLTVMEEAESYRVMLELPASDGGKNTVEQLAERMGRSARTIRERLSLLAMAGTPAGEALASGALPVTHAMMVGRIVTADQPGLLERVLNPETGDGLMSVERLRKVIAEEYMVDLRKGGFDLADAELVPLEMAGDVRVRGGACVDCSFNTMLDADVEKKAGRPAMCRNPKCFGAKRSAEHARWMVSAKSEFCEPLDFAACERIFAPHNGKVLVYNSGFVELDEAPAESDLNDDAPDPAPRWKSLVKERGAMVFLARDKDGEVHTLLKRETAIAAARDNGHEIFRGKKSAKVVAAPEHAPVPEGESVGTIAKPRESEEERAARLRAEARELERVKRVELAMLRGIFHAVCADKRPGIPTFELIVGAVSELVERMEDSSFFATAVAMGYDESAHGRSPAAVGKWLASHVAAVPPEHCLAVAVLVAGGLTVEDARAEWLKSALKACGIARKDVERKVAAEMADEDRLAAEAAEIENGMTWSDNRNKAEEFEWSAENKAEGGTLCALAMPAKTKVEVYITLAKSDKGWHVGYGLAVGLKAKLRSPCSCVATSYVERKLALAQGILALIEAIDSAEKWGPPVIERLTAYVEKLQSDVTTKGANSTKKGGK
jgi:ParB family chromosome partitioning protein